MKLMYAGCLAMMFAIAQPASAQNYSTLSTQVLPQTNYPSSDVNGVDLGTAGREIYGPSLSIGDPAHGGILFRPTIAGYAIYSHYPNPSYPVCNNCYMSGFQGSSNLTAQLTFGGTVWESLSGYAATVTAGGKVARFQSGSPYNGFSEYNPVVGRTLTYTTPAITNNMTNDQATYAAMSFSNTFQDSDGTQYIFSEPSAGSRNYPGCQLTGTPDCSYSVPISRIVKPNGDQLDFYYLVGGSNDFKFTAYTLLSVVSNRGYMIKFQNVGSSTNYIRGAIAINLAVETCNPIAVSCSLTHQWPTISDTEAQPPNIDPIPLTFTDQGKGITYVNTTPAGENPPIYNVSIKKPTGRVETFTFDTTYAGQTGVQNCTNLVTQNHYGPLTIPCPFQHLTSYNDGIHTWSYKTTFGTNGGRWITTTIERTDGFGNKRTTVSIPSGQIISDTDELGHVTTISTIAPLQTNEGRITSITLPEGNSVSFNNYDARGNIWQQVQKPKPGSSLANKTTNYVFPTTCTNWKTCNKPTSVTDPNGKVTSFTYDANSGEVLTETLPADANGISPVHRYGYTAAYAWVSNGSGGYQQNTTPIYLLTEMRTCLTTATAGSTCQGGPADQVSTFYSYGPPSGPNNLNLRGMTVLWGQTTHTTCYGYDSVGNKISETSPNAEIATCP